MQFQDISGVDGCGCGDNSDEQQNEEQAEEEPEEQEEDTSIDWLRVLTVLLSHRHSTPSDSDAAGVSDLDPDPEKKEPEAEGTVFRSSDNRIAVRALFSYLMNLLSVAGLPIRNVSLVPI